MTCIKFNTLGNRAVSNMKCTQMRAVNRGKAAIYNSGKDLAESVNSKANMTPVHGEIRFMDVVAQWRAVKQGVGSEALNTIGRKLGSHCRFESGLRPFEFLELIN